MKRLKYFLALRDENTTYKEVYEGKMHVYPRTDEWAYDVSEPIYWKNDIFYRIERSNRIELTKPTVTIGIPIRKLKIMAGLIDPQKEIAQKGIPGADYCLRAFQPYINMLNEENYNRKRTDKENGKYYLYDPDGRVVKRNCSYFNLEPQKYYCNTGVTTAKELAKEPQQAWYLELMVMIQLPEGKMKKTIQMLTKDLPDAVERYIDEFQINQFKQAITLYNKQEQIRRWLSSSEYCAFIADGSILPREKDTSKPMHRAIPFLSKGVETIQVAGCEGLGIKKGVTVITGGGYSGKSTVLDAINEGIYNHIKGDGREFVITDDSAIKISAEDGRSVKNVNISPFIRWIPGGDPMNFSTEHASGSTSQAANIIEAVQYQSKLLLIDEDKSATNFMIRDYYMQKLVKNEPIVPFTERVQELSHRKKVSTILVIGGSSEYLKVADQVIEMEEYQPYEVTQMAKEIVKNTRYPKCKEKVSWNSKRILGTKHFRPYPENQMTEHLEVSQKGFIELGDECIDTRMIHNIVSISQMNTIALLIRKLQLSNDQLWIDIDWKVKELMRELNENQLDSIYSTFFPQCGRWMELPRKSEVLAVINRMRKVSFQIQQK